MRGRLLVTRVTAGSEFHSCAETTTKRAFCWGDNTFGQLGDGTTTTRLVPVAVAGGLYFSQVGAGDLHTCGKAGNGTVYCWGDGTYGELGNDTSGATIHRTTPQPVLGAMQALVSVAAP